MSAEVHPAAQRVASALGGDPDPVEFLGAGVPGSDLTSFLLDVMQRRASGVTPTSLVRRMRDDRFVELGSVDARALHRVTARLLDAVPETFEVVELSPVAPLGTCSAMAPVDQNKIVSAVRNVEVAADPTNALVLLAATRPGTDQHLAAVQRVLRTQPFGAVGQQHFTILGLAVTGRDQGSLGFERSTTVELLIVITQMMTAVGVTALELRITSLRDRFTEAIVDDVRAALGSAVSVVADPERTAGRGYYRDLCFKVIADPGPDEVEIGDGGFTDWTAQLTGDRKRRTLIAGLGVDRIATLTQG